MPAPSAADDAAKRRKVAQEMLEVNGFVMKLNEELGRGAFGRVVKGHAKDRPGLVRAIKMAQLQGGGAEARREADVGRSLSGWRGACCHSRFIFIVLLGRRMFIPQSFLSFRSNDDDQGGELFIIFCFLSRSCAASPAPPQVLRKLKHINIVRLVDSFEFTSNVGFGMLGLVMELATSTLEKSLPLADGYRRFECVLQLCAAVLFLHEQKTMHRDIKPSNILLFNEYKVESGLGPFYVWKLGDFGLGKELGSGAAGVAATHTNCGTPLYLAPEVQRGEKYSEEADVYSLAVVLTEVLASVGAKRRFGSEESTAVWDFLGGKGIGQILGKERDLSSYIRFEFLQFFNLFNSEKDPQWYDARSLEDLLSAFIWRSHPQVIQAIMSCRKEVAALFWTVPGMCNLVGGRRDVSGLLLASPKSCVESVMEEALEGNYLSPYIYDNSPGYEMRGPEENEFFKFLLDQKQAAYVVGFLGEELGNKTGIYVLDSVFRLNAELQARLRQNFSKYIGACISHFGSSVCDLIKVRVIEVSKHDGLDATADFSVLGFPDEDTLYDEKTETRRRGGLRFFRTS